MPKTAGGVYGCGVPCDTLFFGSYGFPPRYLLLTQGLAYYPVLQGFFMSNALINKNTKNFKKLVDTSQSDAIIGTSSLGTVLREAQRQ